MREKSICDCPLSVCVSGIVSVGCRVCVDSINTCATFAERLRRIYLEFRSYFKIHGMSHSTESTIFNAFSNFDSPASPRPLLARLTSQEKIWKKNFGIFTNPFFRSKAQRATDDRRKFFQPWMGRDGQRKRQITTKLKQQQQKSKNKYSEIYRAHAIAEINKLYEKWSADETEMGNKNDGQQRRHKSPSSSCAQ